MKNKKTVLTVVSISVAALIVSVLLWEPVLRLPGILGIEKKREYNALKNAPPEDVWDAGIGYDGFSPLPETFEINGVKYNRIPDSAPWHFTDEGSEYLGKKLVTASGWMTGHGYGYTWSEVYSYQDTDGNDALYRFSSVDVAYLEESKTTDPFFAPLNSSRRIFSEIEQPFCLGDISDLSQRFTARGLQSESSTESLISIDDLLPGGSGTAFRNDLPSMYIRLLFFSYKDDFYLKTAPGRYYYRITNINLISELDEIVK